MYRHLASRPARAALFVAVSVLLAMPAAVAAHAEFERSTPGDGEIAQGSPRVIRAFFSEELADGSEMALLDEAGTTIAEGSIDPANPTRMRIDPPELEPGDYDVQWKAFADDGHLETGTFTFTVSAPITPPPSAPPSSALPTPSAPVSAPPAASALPTASAVVVPSPTEGAATPPANAAGTSDVLFPIIAAVVIVAVLGGYLFMRRRPAQP